MIRIMEHLFYEETLKELWLFSLEKWRLWVALIVTFYRGTKVGTNFLAGTVVLDKGNTFKLKEVRFRLDKGNIFFMMSG